jgi:hypothetical protein
VSPAELKAAVRVFLEEQLRQHFTKRGDLVNEHSLQVDVTRLRRGSSSAYLTVKVAGTINARRFALRKRAYRQGSHYIGGGMVGALAAAAVEQAVRAAIGALSADKHVSDCAEEVCVKLLIAIDRHLGVPASELECRWQRWRIARWAGGLLVLAGLVSFNINRGWGQNPPPFTARLLTATFMMAIPTACLFAVAFFVCVLLMPAEFFANELQGRRVQAISGVKSLRALRILSVVLIVGFTACTAGLLYWLVYKLE